LEDCTGHRKSAETADALFIVLFCAEKSECDDPTSDEEAVDSVMLARDDARDKEHERTEEEYATDAYNALNLRFRSWVVASNPNSLKLYDWHRVCRAVAVIR
jgi:hypothetical protein